MKNLPHKFIDLVWSEYESNLRNLTIDDTLSFTETSSNIELIEHIYNEEIIKRDMKFSELKRRRNQTKKRWTTSAIKDLEKKTKKTKKELEKELQFFEQYYYNFGSDNFSSTFNFKTPNELITKKSEELKQWSNEENSLLVNYLYIKDRTKKQIKNAILLDLSTITSSIYEQEFNSNLKSLYVEQPLISVEHPIFLERREKIKISSTTVEGDNSDLYYYNDYKPTPNYKIRTLISKEFLEDNAASFLDDLDNKIFEQVLSHRSTTFATHRKIYLTIGDIVKEIYKSNSIKNYHRVANRLKKMLNLKFNVHDNEKFIGFSIFDMVSIDYNNNWSVEVTIGEVLHQEYLNNFTIKLYRDEINKLEERYSKSLNFILQKERLENIMKFKGQESFIIRYDYKFFIHKLRLPTRTYKKNLEFIENSLNELIKLNLGILKYERKNNIFNITFKRLEDYEKKDLLDASVFKEPDDNILSYSGFDNAPE